MANKQKSKGGLIIKMKVYDFINEYQDVYLSFYSIFLLETKEKRILKKKVMILTYKA